MALLGPNSSDITKLHNAVNQCDNNRFLVVMATVSAFGVITGFILSNALSTPPGTGGPTFIRPLVPVLCAFANVVYIVLYLMTLLILDDLTMLTAYLRYTKASRWEQDYKTYENSQYNHWWRAGYSRSVVLCFTVVMALTF